MMNYPLWLSIITVLCLWAFALIGAFFRRRKAAGDSEPGEYGIALSATLTLLGLLIGFSFSMAVGRYDQRKNNEEEEANAIGTEYLRAELLSDSARQKVQGLLVQYLDLRIRAYRAHASDEMPEVAAKTAQLHQEMWNEVRIAVVAVPPPLMGPLITGMNDVINRQGYTRAARLNRIPLPAWVLMAMIAVFSNFLIGYSTKSRHPFLLVIVPIVISVSFLLIADIDSPQGGLIRVAPQNLIALSDSLRTK